MSIVVNLDVGMVMRKVRSKELAKKIDISEQNLSIFKVNNAKAIRFSKLEEICQALDCQPGDVLVYETDEN